MTLREQQYLDEMMEFVEKTYVKSIDPTRTQTSRDNFARWHQRCLEHIQEYRKALSPEESKT